MKPLKKSETDRSSFTPCSFTTKAQRRYDTPLQFLDRCITISIPQLLTKTQYVEISENTSANFSATQLCPKGIC